MSDNVQERRQAWSAIAIFLVLTTALSSVFHYAIVNLMPTSHYVGPLMWSPAIAAMLTLLIQRRKISSLPWQWGKWRFNLSAFLVPVLYIAMAYAVIWGAGLGGFPNSETLTEWSAELGLEGYSPTTVAIVMILIVGTIGCIRAMSTIVGEEIGWRGFFIWELRKVMPFGAVAFVSGLIWSAWHWPIVYTYGGGDPLIQIANFTVMITAMSVILAYFTFKSNSLWPAVMFHAAHNVYSDKIFGPLTSYSENTSLWTGEYGFMLPITASLLAVVFWRKAKAEGM